MCTNQAVAARAREKDCCWPAIGLVKDVHVLIAKLAWIELLRWGGN
jgi:hypothetical protein